MGEGREHLEARLGRASLSGAKARIFFLVSPLLVGLLLFSHNPLFTYMFPAAAVAAAWFFLVASAEAYTTFIVWLWLLDPLLRRLVDFQSGNGNGSLILLAPYLACCAPLFYMIVHRKSIFDRFAAPLFFMFAAIFYGFLVGLSNFPVAAVIQGLVTWVAPLCMALFVYQNYGEVEHTFHAFEKAMIYGTLVIGAYGVLQYFAPPKWDVLWMVNVNNPTFGIPKAMQVRVFSTMNAPQILALFLASGILLALHSKSKIRFLAAPVGALALIFTMARTAWVSLGIGLLYLLFKAQPRVRFQIVAAFLTSFIMFGFALQNPHVALMASQRADTLLDVRHDYSFAVRLDGYRGLFASAIYYPFGLGIGGQATGSDREEHTINTGGQIIMQSDSTLASLIVSLGGAGTLLAFASMFLLALSARRLRAAPGTAPEAIKILIVVLISETLFNNVVTGPGGFLSWTVLGLCLAFSKAVRVSERSISRNFNDWRRFQYQ